MIWRKEPQSADEALRRLVNYFPELEKNITSGQPSLPSRSRDALETAMKEKPWLKNFIREVWHKEAIEKCFPKLKD
ncbi:MAG: hypothetical protein J1E97_02920 [Muribaculaceae bacterium]|nr:hypothetical protein [Muribaculaceae bacterium]